MTEQVRYTKIYAEDLATGTGTEEVTLADGRVVAMHKINPSNFYVTATGSTTARLLADRFADVINVKDFGAVGDGATDDTAAIQLAIDTLFQPTASNFGHGVLYFPNGDYKITTVLTLPNAQFRIFGDGTGSVIRAYGCSAFAYPGAYSTQSYMRNLFLYGNSTAGTYAFTSAPTVTSDVFSFVYFSYIRTFGFASAFNVPNAQICSWNDCYLEVDTSGSIFRVYPSVDGQAANSNRIYNCAFRGTNAQTVDFNYGATNARCANWKFESCDFQQDGTTIPLTIKDIDWTVQDCEFENSTATCLIDIVADDAIQPNNAMLSNLVLVGGGANGKIRLRRTGVTQKTYYVTLMNCNAGGGSVLVDIVSGRSTTIMNGTGTINDTGGEFTQIIGGTHALGTAGATFPGVYVKTALVTGGAGSPEGAVTAPAGSVYFNSSGGASTTLYVKESGSGNTGWIAK